MRLAQSVLVTAIWLTATCGCGGGDDAGGVDSFVSVIASEPNDSMAEATFAATLYPGQHAVIDGVADPLDTDWIEIYVVEPCQLRVTVQTVPQGYVTMALYVDGLHVNTDDAGQWFVPHLRPGVTDLINCDAEPFPPCDPNHPQLYDLVNLPVAPPRYDLVVDGGRRIHLRLWPREEREDEWGGGALTYNLFVGCRAR